MSAPDGADRHAHASVTVSTDGRGIAHLVLNRPEVRNALGPGLIAAARRQLGALRATPRLRALVLRGAGSHFCSGVDLEWMRSLQRLEPRRVAQESAPLVELMRELDEMPVPVIGVAHGFAVAGGMGLLASCDLVIAHTEACFQVAEAKLGLVPATIAPFLLRKIGYSNLRGLACTAARADSRAMLAAGLVHRVTDDIEAALQDVLAEVLQVAPEAVALCKRMLREMQAAAGGDQTGASLDWVAESRGRACAVEGVAAFLEKRKPGWWP